MARQRTTTQGLRTIVGVGLAGPGLAAAIGNVDGLACQLVGLLGAIARDTLILLPSLMPTAWEALQAHVLGHALLFSCVLELFVSSLPLLRVIAGA